MDTPAGRRPDDPPAQAPGKAAARPADHSLDGISTQWTTLRDPTAFVTRYGAAVRGYLERLLRNADDAEEVSQEFLMRAIQHGFATAQPGRGRFRHYLKVAVRHAALNFLRRRQTMRKGQERLAEHLAAAAEGGHDAEWLDDYRDCLLQNVWRRLERHEEASPGCLFHTVLKAAADHPDSDSATLAAQVGRRKGQKLSAEAFRQQLSRGRRLFAGFLVEEVRLTVDEPGREQVDEELAALGLLSFVEKFLAK